MSRPTPRGGELPRAGDWVDKGGIESAVFDLEMHRAMECEDVYIAHIAAETFTCGRVRVLVTPPGMGEVRDVDLPVVGVGEPRVLLFSVLSCLEVLGIETEMRVAGVWFAVDSVPARFIVRREAGGVELDVRDGERNGLRCPLSFVEDETPDNTGRASMLVGTPGATRSPDVSSEARGKEEESTGRTELSDLINEELEVIMRDGSDAATSPSLGYPSPREGSFIYDSCDVL